jgi:predicted transcriptional regulator
MGYEMAIQVDPKQQVTLRLPQSMIAQLNVLAEKEDRLPSWLMRKAIQELLDRYAAREAKGRAV